MWIRILIFLISLTFCAAQEEAEQPKSTPKQRAEAYLKEAYVAGSELKGDSRVAFLSRLVSAAANSKIETPPEWQEEFEGLVSTVQNECRRLLHQSQLVRVKAKKDTRIGLDFLARLEAGKCGGVLEFLHYHIFRQAVNDESVQPNEIVAVMRHLGEIGQFPHNAAIQNIAKLSQRDAAAGAELFVISMRVFQSRKRPKERVDEFLLTMVHVSKNKLPKELLKEGLEAVFKDLEENPPDNENKYTSSVITHDGRRRQSDPYNTAIVSLRHLASEIDKDLALRIERRFSGKDLSPENISTMVVMPEGQAMSAEARAMLDAAELRARLRNPTAKEIESLNISSQAKATLFAEKAIELAYAEPKKDPDEFLSKALRLLEGIEEKKERFKLAVTIAEAAWQAKAPARAEAATSIAIELGLPLASEEVRKGKRELNQTFEFLALNGIMAGAGVSDEVIVEKLRTIEDAEFKALLLASLAESTARSKR